MKVTIYKDELYPVYYLTKKYHLQDEDTDNVIEVSKEDYDNYIEAWEKVLTINEKLSKLYCLVKEK
jgi:hypothetical protein